MVTTLASHPSDLALAPDVLASSQVSGVPLREQRVIVFSAGTAGIGIAAQIRDAMAQGGLPKDAATQRIWGLDRGCQHQHVDGSVHITVFERGVARLVAHEIDHLVGVLYTDRMADSASVIPVEQYRGGGQSWQYA